MCSVVWKRPPSPKAGLSMTPKDLVSPSTRCIISTVWSWERTSAAGGRDGCSWGPGSILLHLDVKKLGRIQGIGHRIHVDRRNSLRNRGIGWDFVHVAIDDASRVPLAGVLPTS